MTNHEFQKELLLHKLRLAENQRRGGLGYIPAAIIFVLGLLALVAAFFI